MNISTLSNILNAKFLGDDIEIFGLTTDSNATKPGDLFIARRGLNLDGHDYILRAKQNGATAALVDHVVADVNLPQIIVEDTSQALASLGALKRQQYPNKLLAVTGSCGKTTTKAMLATILGVCGKTFVSAKSFNNAVGLPLTLWNLSPEHQYAVLELGANHHGEIAALVDIIKPINVALITNAEPCHLEGFDNVAGVARAKSEIFSGLSADGIAIINADSDYCNFWLKVIQKHQYLTFGIKNKSDISAKNVKVITSDRIDFTLTLPSGEIDIALPLSGTHNLMNALAAASAATAIGADSEAIKVGLETFAPVKMRLVFRTGLHGSRIIDDTYNANPSAVKAALEVLMQQKGEKIFVFGGMRELGEQAEYWHRYVGKIAKEMGVDYLFNCGQYSNVLAEEFGNCGYAFDSQTDLIAAVQRILDDNKIILVKGSRGAAMENVVQALII